VPAETRYRGIRGWLLLLCVNLTVLLPFLMLIVVLGSFADVSDGATAGFMAGFHLLLTLPLTGFGVYAGLQLWRVRPGAVRKARGFFMTSFILAAGIAVLAGVMMAVNSGRPEAAVQEIGRGLVSPACGTVIWLVYLDRSKRVKANFPRG
jgi:hypothetical protein